MFAMSVIISHHLCSKKEGKTMKETVKKYENTYAKFNYEMLQFTLPMTLILICGDVYFLMVCLEFLSDA